MKILLLLCIIILSGCASIQQEAEEAFCLTESDEEITESSKGYIDQKSKDGEKNASLSLRVPSTELKPVVEKIGKIGDVTKNYVSSKDVCNQKIIIL